MLIRPVATYRAESWALNKDIVKRFATLLFNIMLETAVTRSKGKHGEPYVTGVVNLWFVQ